MSEHGRFIWYELATSSVAGAKAFYPGLMGWELDETTGAAMNYTIAGPAGAGVAGIAAMQPDAAAAGVPPHWLGYVAVDDVDAAAAKVKGLGGAVQVEPTDIPGIGRFAVIADPTGAAIAIMKPVPPETARPELALDAPGNVGWHELYAGELEKAFAFYAELFGWMKDSDMDMGPMGAYRLFSNQIGQIGGMMKKPDQMQVPAWLYYVNVGDIDQAAARITAGGGQVTNGPMEVPGGGWIVQASDPQGAMFAVAGKRAT
jgi:predicted enzyme related to lactoylglutathione lyase